MHRTELLHEPPRPVEVMRYETKKGERGSRGAGRGRRRENE